MHIRLTGRRAMISGSTAGIGYAIARGLAAAGAAVVVNGRTDARVADAVARLKSEVSGAEVSGIAADLGTAGGVAQFVVQAPRADILVNSLGIFEPKPFFEIEDADWKRFFQVNVMSGIRLSRHYAQGMVRRGWGRIVFISSESGVDIPAEMVHYGATKTAQISISRGLAETLAGSGVTVNAVLPGPTRSDGAVEFLGKMSAGDPRPQEEIEADFIAKYRPTSLIKRFASVEEVANMVVYVCSEQASATTGAALRVEGGLLRSIL